MGALFRKSITLEKNKCTYLELCGSINDALWDDETQNSNKVQQRRGVKRSKQTDRQRGKYIYILKNMTVSFSEQKSSHVGLTAEAK